LETDDQGHRAAQEAAKTYKKQLAITFARELAIDLWRLSTGTPQLGSSRTHYRHRSLKTELHQLHLKPVSIIRISPRPLLLWPSPQPHTSVTSTAGLMAMHLIVESGVSAVVVIAHLQQLREQALEVVQPGTACGGAASQCQVPRTA
jgi:hypothetical protein